MREADIITPISPRDEEHRQHLGHLGPQNYQTEEYFNHMSARRVRELIGSKTWDSYYKFCFERNPWDKVISWFYWELNNTKSLNFGHFMESGHFALVGGRAGYDLYTDSRGDVIWDDVYIYEEMRQAMISIEQTLGVSLPLLPNAKSQFRPSKRPLRSYYSKHHMNMVSESFQREIQKFGYQFEATHWAQS